MWRLRWSIWQTLADLFEPGSFTEPNSTDIIAKSLADGGGEGAIRRGEEQRVEVGTQKAAEKRDEAIKNNCKKPT